MNKLIWMLLFTSIFHSCGSSQIEEAPYRELIKREKNARYQFLEMKYQFEQEGKKFRFGLEEQIQAGTSMLQPRLDLILELMDRVKKDWDFFEGLRNQLRQIGALEPNTGELHNPDERDENARLLIDEGKAKALHNLLEDFALWGTDFAKEIDPSGSPEPLVSAADHEPDWEARMFAGHSVLHNLGTLMEIEVKYQQSVQPLLRSLTSSVSFDAGEPGNPQDSLYLEPQLGKPVVKAGENYEMILTLMPRGLDYYPDFSGDGAIELLPGGRSAKFTIPAMKALPAGQSEAVQEFELKATVSRNDGTRMELIYPGKFKVVK